MTLTISPATSPSQAVPDAPFICPAPTPSMTLPSFDLGYGTDDDATITTYDQAADEPRPEDLKALKDESPSPSPRLRSMSDISREPTPAETSARISSWLEGLSPPRNPSALRAPSSSRHTRFPGFNPSQRHGSSYLLSDSGSNIDSLTPLPSSATFPTDSEARAATPATSIQAFQPPAPPATKRRATAPNTATLTILGPDLAAHMPRAGTPEFALLFAAVLVCALVAPRIVFIIGFAYLWGRVSERAFCGTHAEREGSLDGVPEEQRREDEGIRIGRRLARMVGMLA